MNAAASHWPIAPAGQSDGKVNFQLLLIVGAAWSGQSPKAKLHSIARVTHYEAEVARWQQIVISTIATEMIEDQL